MGINSKIDIGMHPTCPQLSLRTSEGSSLQSMVYLPEISARDFDSKKIL